MNEGVGLAKEGLAWSGSTPMMLGAGCMTSWHMVGVWKMKLIDYKISLHLVLVKKDL